MSCWIELYLEMVNLLLKVIKFQRTGNWNGFLQAIRNFLRFYFAMNWHNYARNWSYYFISMLNLQDSHPNIYQYLKNMEGLQLLFLVYRFRKYLVIK